MFTSILEEVVWLLKVIFVPYAVAEYLENQRDYRVNRHTLEPEIAQAIAVRWANYCEQYGYHHAAVSTVNSESADDDKENA